MPITKRLFPAAVAAATVVSLFAGTVPADAASTCGSACRLTKAARSFVQATGGPPAIVITVRHGGSSKTITGGVADLQAQEPPSADDEMRVASVAKAYSGAVALSLVSDGQLSLDDTVGELLPTLPRRWAHVTLRQLLDHTSRIPDFSQQPSFRDALIADPQHAPTPATLLDYARDVPLQPRRANNYHYSNSDNVIVALMAAAVTHNSYEDDLESQVLRPLGLGRTSLPTGSSLTPPFLHGYALSADDPPEDVTSLFTPGWAWASGGVVSTPTELARFVRAYVSGKLFNKTTRHAQFQFVAGSSEPPGPGTNAAGLALFRYSMACGTVYGHTGNTAGYTQFAAASANGADSVTVSVTAQITPSSDP
ncbi:MAG TPA: serine hydrolase domain-containing protein, partial [Acidimicrobiales bacterium]|nr:serine hydrolase domain-containing protein [Acidimicrobiales bacterium]